MARYIDATEITKQIADFKKAVNSPNSDYMTGYLSALSVTEGMIANTPTADVVEVVRCKDCAYCRYVEGVGIYRCDRQGYYSEEVKPTDYCSFGEGSER